MAGRIPQKFIDDLLDRTDIVELVDRRVQLKKTGRNYSACCPFHDEKTPSFSVNPDKQFYYCFGCGAGGNAIGFIMDYDRLEFPQAVEQLANLAGLEVPRESQPDKQAEQKKRNIYSILDEANQFYGQQLRHHQQAGTAVNYLKQRGLTGQIAKTFSIGFAPPGWDNLLKSLGNTAENKQFLIDCGLLVNKPEQNKCYDAFRNRIMFPIRDSRGRVIAFGGRVLDDSLPKYLNSPESSAFHKSRELYGLYEARQANRQLKRVVIVEGYMDVVALAQHGITYAAATLGTATSTEHLKRVFRYCNEVIFCFDGDAAGRRAAIRALENALPEMSDGRSARFLFLPEGEDPDSLVRKIGADDFSALLDEATPLEQYLFESQSENLDLGTLEGRAHLSKRAAPLVNQLPEGIFKQLMLDSLAQRTGVNRETLIALTMPPAQLSEDTAAPPMPDAPPPKQRQARAAEPVNLRNPLLYALALVLHQPRAALHLSDWHELREHPSPYAKLLIELIEIIEKRPDTSTHSLLGHGLGHPSGEILAELLGAERHIPDEGIEKELSDTIFHIKQQPGQEALNSMVENLKGTQFEALSDEEKQRLRQMIARRSVDSFSKSE